MRVTDPIFPLMAMSRHRIQTDGQGVTTLVCAWGCPLRCALCINQFCHDASTTIRRVTPDQLYETTRVDDLYFQATGGGVTFGGGEPLLHAGFIAAFRALCGDAWRLRAETSLYVDAALVTQAAACVDEFFVDIKDTDPAIYERYTGLSVGPVMDNLGRLLDLVGSDRVTVRVPSIPGYNAPDDVSRSVDRLKRMGVTRLDRFDYIIPASRERPSGA